MTSITDKIRSDLGKARKDRDLFKIQVLSTVLGNVTAKAKLVDGQKVTTDEDAIAYVKQHLKGLNELFEIKQSTITSDEMSLVLEYLPKQLTKKQLEDELKVSGAGVIKDYMAHLKTKFSNQFDGKMASEVFKDWATN